MKTKSFLGILILTACLLPATAQTKQTDSIAVVATFKELLSICRNVDFSDPKGTDSGMFYKAAPYIIYRGEDQKRNWKDFAVYRNKKEKKQVDAVCYRIHELLNRDSSYTILKYFNQKESEGLWHVLMVTTKRKGVDKELVFAFLKVKGRFCLGDID